MNSTQAANRAERVERRAVAPHQHKVLAQRPAHVGPAQVAHGVLHHMRHGMVGPRHAEAHRVRHAVGQQRPDLRVARVAPVRGAAKIAVSMTQREQLIDGRSVVSIGAARRCAEPQAEPRQVAQDRLFRARNRAAAIGIINTHQKRRIAASQLALPREQVIEQRGPRAADVQRAGGRRREAEPYRFARCAREGAAHHCVGLWVVVLCLVRVQIYFAIARVVQTVLGIAAEVQKSLPLRALASLAGCPCAC